MKKVFIIPTILAFLLGFKMNSKAQDVYFSQFYANPIYLNSALAGSEGNPRLTLAHRQQWSNLQAYNASYFSFDTPLGKQSGLAIHALNDQQMDGVIKNNAIGTTLSHRIELNNRAVIGSGISLNYFQKSFDWSGLTFEDQLSAGSSDRYPTAERFGQSRTNMVDIGVGFVYATDKLVAGLNISHINTPQERFNPESDAILPRRYSAHIAYRFQKYSYSKKAYSLTPSIVYENQAAMEYLNVGGYWSNNFLTLGTWYRLKQAMVFTIGFSYQQFNLGYSYDHSLQNAQINYGATNEFTMSYRFQWKGKDPSKQYRGKCPDLYKSLR
ncbi:PorP/SprF family type IX secretion system membrane protein [Marivirga harenae]|uniref:PorP/SprF family type IX secretion system membrane protein n=1 Tax=Marivirga harenae TaxID=2010992 RepID=UPI0026DF95AD|nr:PorP/SprF family type IX secretion system membrane protein [Marivirga harenae]WKV11140.1 PorP/SprF family type IX secretion system membrane protein [Marivirga harenae]|tara:strand:- start:37762 stop:38739 length:978 start_codon:yes stop_codon:yes gene_type:complete